METLDGFGRGSNCFGVSSCHCIRLGKRSQIGTSEANHTCPMFHIPQPDLYKIWVALPPLGCVHDGCVVFDRPHAMPTVAW